MTQKARLKKKRRTVKGIAIKKNKDPEAVRKITKNYGNIQVTTYQKKGDDED